MKSRFLLIVIVASMLMGSSLALVAANPVEGGDDSMTLASPPFVDHNAIQLLNDTDLLDQASSEGWPGSGTPNDPIIIEGLEINTNATPASFYAQHISLSVVVRDCSIISTDYDGNAIAILNVSGMRFENLTIEGENGLVAVECSDISVVDSSITAGIYTGNAFIVGFDACQDVTLSGNVLTETIYERVYFINCDDLDINNNTLITCNLALFSSTEVKISDNIFLDSETFGVYMAGTDHVLLMRNQFIGGETGLLMFDPPGIPTTNTALVENVFENGGIQVTDTSSFVETLTSDGDIVNGKPLYILKNVDMQGEMIPNDMGQYILFRVKNAVIDGANIERNCGIYLSECEGMTIRNSTFEGIFGYGISLFDSEDTLIQYCTFTDMNHGVWGQLQFSETTSRNTTITGCQFINIVTAIHEGFCEDLNIYDNTFKDCGMGINLGSETNVTIDDNLFEDIDLGIVISSMNPLVKEMSSENVLITHNLMNGCAEGIELITSREVIVQDNKMMNGGDSCIVILGSVDNTTISENWIEGYDEFAVRMIDIDLDPCENLVFHSNAFIDNNGANSTYDPTHVQVEDFVGSGAEWSIEAENGQEGNFWSDLTGPEEDHSGFLAVPYVIIDGEISDPRPFASMTPYAPQNLTATVSSNSVNLTWNAPDFDGMSQIDGYQVMLNVNGSWDVLTTVTGTSYVHGDLSPGQSYEYAVMAFNGFGSGQLSDPVTAEVPSEPTDVVSLVIIAVLICIPLFLIFVPVKS